MERGVVILNRIFKEDLPRKLTSEQKKKNHILPHIVTTINTPVSCVNPYLCVNTYIYLASISLGLKDFLLAWKIPWMEEPGRLQSMGSLRVGHN